MYETGELLLGKIGFSGYERAIIHVLLKYGALAASDITAKSDVPLPKVYQTLSARAPSSLMKTYRSITRSKDHKTARYSIDIRRFADELVRENPENEDSVSRMLTFYSEEPTRRVVLPKFIELKVAGKKSQDDTMELYKSAKREIDIISRSMGYLPSVYDGLWTAAKNGVKIRILFPHRELLSNRKSIEEVEQRLRLVHQLPADPKKNPIEVKLLSKAIRQFGANRMWLHGSIIDPPTEEDVKEYSGKYTGACIFTIDLPEDEQGRYEREVVFSKDPRFVMSLKLFFGLLWQYCTHA
jgi:hypothetical protein